MKKVFCINTAAIVFLTLVLSVLGNALGAHGAPAAQMMLGIIVGGIISQINKLRIQLSQSTTIATSALIGVLMGSYLPINKLEQLGTGSLCIIALSCFTIILGVFFARALIKFGKLDSRTALLGMLPGGSAAVVSASKEIGAHPELVAFMQYIRVAIVATCAPWIYTLLNISETESFIVSEHASLWVDIVDTVKEYYHSAITKHHLLGLFITALIALAGYIIGKILALPSPAILGAMALSMLVESVQITPEYAPEGLWKDVLFVLVGLEVGLNFSKSSVKQAVKILPLILICVIGICVLTGFLAIGLANLLHMNGSDIYLATTPGGINAVIGTAQSSNTDVTMITTAQSFRLICSLVFLPLLVYFSSLKKIHFKDQLPLAHTVVKK